MKLYLSIFFIFLTFVFMSSLPPSELQVIDSNNQNIQFDSKEPEYIPAYDFKLNLLQSNNNDSLINLSSLKGSVVLINFWATWCGPCIAEIPEFNQLYDKYKNQNFEILSISISDTQNQLDKFVKKFPVHYKILFGSQKEIAIVVQNYGGFNSIPISYLVNRDGMVVRGYPSAIVGEYWSSALENDIIKFLNQPKKQ